jgi:hypothetical protein
VTSSLPDPVQEAFERFVTTEFTTVDRRQQPITWPLVPYYSTGSPTIDVNTGLGYPKKADDAKRHPRVAMLFSEPHGSGIKSGIQVLVQGIAEVDEENLDANRERYAREIAAKLPATVKMHPPKFIQRQLNWYYTRIYIKVRPERVFVWPEGDVTRPPEVHDCHLEEVRSGHSEEPVEPHEPAAGGDTAWDERIDQIGAHYETGVVSWVGPDGFPIAVRLPLRVDRSARRIELGAEPAGLPLVEGRACVTVHEHGEGMTWQRNFQVRGDLARGGSGWAVIPHDLVGGFEIPKGIARMRSFIGNHWRFYKTAKRRLAEGSG